MNFNRKEHGRFIQYLDRTAEKNPLLWLPCVALIALALAAEHIVEHAHLHNNTEKDIRKIPQSPKKPFFLRAVAVTLTAAFSLMLVPAASLDAFGEEYGQITEQVDFNEVSEDKEISDAEKPTVTEESADTEEPTDDEETADTEESTAGEEPTDTEEPADADEPTDDEETADTEESTDTEEPIIDEEQEFSAEETAYNEGISLLTVCTQHEIHSWSSFDEHGHTGKCAVCGYIISEPHELVVTRVTNPTKTRTGIKESECTICSCKITVTLTMSDHDHKISEEWSYDSVRHWHPCENTNCEAISGLAKHTFVFKWDDNGIYHWEECKVCGYKKYDTFILHTFIWKHTTTKHYQQCTECNYKTAETDHNFHWVHNGDSQYHRQECYDCSYQKSTRVKHNFSEDWQSDDSSHWQGGCTDCGYTNAQISPHDDLKWDSDGSLHWKYCATCGWESAKTSHRFNWHKDDDEHWRECECGFIKDRAGHIIDNTNWKTSNTEHWHVCASLCGFKADIGVHDWKWNSLDASGHRQVCAVCGEKADTVPHVFDGGTVTVQPTETETGTRVYTCTLCGYSYEEEIPETGHTHDFGEEWKHNTSDHWHECACGEKSGIANHTYEAEVLLQPTETEKGTRKYTCTECDYSYEEEIPETGHTHDFGEEWKHNTSDHWHECVCGEKSGIANHTYEAEVLLQPTETEKGTRKYTCTVCEYSYDEIIPELGHTHTFGTEWHKDENDHWHECTACDEITDVAPHISDDGTVTVQPTSTSAGVKSYKCRICGYIIKTEPIPALAPTENVTDPVYYPSTTVTEAPLRLPYVTNAPEIKGWENIAVYINASPDGVTIPITMNGEIEMPKRISECIINRNITLSIKTNTGPVWTVKGLDVTDPKTVNLRVSERFNKIPASVIDDLISEFEPKEYRLYHSGDFGFKATLTLNIGKKYNDYYAVLYHYNTKTGQLEFVDESFVKNRQVTFELTHASEYAVAFNSVSMYDDVSSGAGVFESSIPIETSAMPETSGVTVPAIKLPQIMKYSNKKRRYRILKKRRLDDLVFVF